MYYYINNIIITINTNVLIIFNGSHYVKCEDQTKSPGALMRLYIYVKWPTSIIILDRWAAGTRNGLILCASSALLHSINIFFLFAFIIFL